MVNQQIHFEGINPSQASRKHWEKGNVLCNFQIFTQNGDGEKSEISVIYHSKILRFSKFSPFLNYQTYITMLFWYLASITTLIELILSDKKCILVLWSKLYGHFWRFKYIRKLVKELDNSNNWPKRSSVYFTSSTARILLRVSWIFLELINFSQNYWYIVEFSDM